MYTIYIVKYDDARNNGINILYKMYGKAQLEEKLCTFSTTTKIIKKKKKTSAAGGMVCPGYPSR